MWKELAEGLRNIYLVEDNKCLNRNWHVIKMYMRSITFMSLLNKYGTEMNAIYVLNSRIRWPSLLHVRLEVFTAVTMKNGVFRDVTPCGSCKNRRFG
jgi:hypothetical protein